MTSLAGVSEVAQVYIISYSSRLPALGIELKKYDKHIYERIALLFNSAYMSD